MSTAKPSQEPTAIRSMFAQIADRYDLLNHLLSGGTDIAWRNMAVKEVMTGQETMILDLACGTGDLAMALERSAPSDCKVVGADFTGPMLQLAQKKKSGAAIDWIQGDGLNLSFSDNSFDLVTVAFGIRNMASLERALSECLRVLKPGGKLLILEFSKPDNPIIRTLYMPYFIHILPRIAALISNRSAYRYLPMSVLHFPNRKELARQMLQSGFVKVRHCALSFGIAAIHIGSKPQEINH